MSRCMRSGIAGGVLVALALGWPHLQAARPVDHVPGELLVKLRPGPTFQGQPYPHAQVGARVTGAYPQTGWQLVRLPDGLTVAQGLGRYRVMSGVLAVQPNYIRRVTRTPNDPDFDRMVGLNRIGAPAAWDVTTGSTNVVVALIDSGVFYSHEDLKDNLWRNPGEIPDNGIDDDGNGYVDDVYGIDAHNHDSDPLDDDGHGTYCAGILGAVGNNGRGGVGVNWSVQIMALKYSGPDGLGHDADLVECFEYAILMKQRGVNVGVTSNSYGGDENGPAIQDAIDAAGRAGILNVFAAGNKASDTDLTPFYPASFDSPSIIAVASTDLSDNLSSFSNYGATRVHLAAPGELIWTTGLGASTYVSFAGTSAACPHVAGAAALLLAYAPSLSVAELKAALLGSVDVAPQLKGKLATNGRLNVARALQNLNATNAPVIVASVTPTGNRTAVTAAIVVTFSKPMSRPSVEAGFSLTPGVAGAFTWSDDDRTCAFKPYAALTPAISYTGRIAATAQDIHGATLDGNYTQTSEGPPTDDFIWSFRVPPTNDDFANGELINGSSGTATGTNRNATRERGEPRHAHNTGGASVWYEWTAPANVEATFDTAGSDFQTLLAVYVGELAPELTEISSASSIPPERVSGVTFRAAAGAAYRVAVDGVNPNDFDYDYPAEGRLLLNWATAPLSPLPRPTISGFVPTNGAPGTEVTIQGVNFIAATAVQFSGVNAAYRIAADSRIVAAVPEAATTGRITVTTAAGTGVADNDFVVTSPAGQVRLGIRIGENAKLELAWSVSLADYQIEATDELGPATTWEVLSGAVIRGEELVWAADPPAGRRFFRLRRP